MNPNPENQATRKFLKVLILSVIGTFLLLVSINYTVDRYYVFHPQDEPFTEFLEPNMRVLKANYLEKHCAQFDAVIFGSSRAAAISTVDTNRTLGVTAYNFGVATGSLPGVLARLEWLDGMDCMPRTIILPISIDRLHFTERPNDLLRKEHPAIVGDPAYSREFLLSYLGVDAFFSNLKKVMGQMTGQPEPRFRYDPRSGDVDYLWDRELDLLACPGSASRTDGVTIGRYVDYLQRIDSLVSESGSRLVLLWNPIPVMDQLAHLDDARELLSRFDGAEHLLYRLPPDEGKLFDGNWYHDLGHYKPELAAAVLAQPQNRVPFRQLLNELETLQNQCSSQHGAS